MEAVALTFFPLPYILDGVRHDGFRHEWVNRCQSCDRQCESATADGGLKVCSYGVNYCRVDDRLTVAGFVVRDYAHASAARTKMLRTVSRGPSVAEVEGALKRLRVVDADLLAEIKERQDAIVEEYRRSGAYKTEVLSLLQPQLKQMFSQIHDYRQFVSTVVQNMNVIVERRDASDAPIEQKLARASHEEVAIYWAARMLEERLQAALFLVEPERLDSRKDDVTFRLHGCVTKYLRIYQRSFELKRVQIEQTGESYGQIHGNPAAIGVIPHTLLDNALKYSPQGAKLSLHFDEGERDIGLTVGSYGPVISPDEAPRIFELFFRGRRAQELVPDGTGFGLYLAQHIATKLGSRITMRQDPSEARGDRIWTEFSVRFLRHR